MIRKHPEAPVNSVKVLRWLFSVEDKEASLDFFTRVLGMKITREEKEIESIIGENSASISSNDSTTTLGYGPERTHFSLELKHQAGGDNVQAGNNFGWISIRSSAVMKSVEASNYEHKPLGAGLGKGLLLLAPGGYSFRVLEGSATDEDVDPVEEIALHVSSLDKSLEYWSGLLGLAVLSRGGSCGVLKAGPGQCRLALQETGRTIFQTKPPSQITFSCPPSQLQRILEMEGAGGLSQPCRQTPEELVVIDLDGHTIHLLSE